MSWRRIATLAAVVTAPLISGCAAQYSGGGDGPLKGAKIAFGSKDFTEQKVLGQIAVQYLRSQGHRSGTRPGWSAPRRFAAR